MEMCDTSCGSGGGSKGVGCGNGEFDSETGESARAFAKGPFDVCGDGSSCIKLQHLFNDSPVPLPMDTPESTVVDILRKLSAEFTGTAMLVFIVVGSGIMAQNLSTDVGLQLIQNAISTCGGLIGLILAFGPVSGAHFNPVVSMVDFLNQDMSLRDLLLYVVFQICGAIVGAIVSNAQFNIPTQLSTKDRSNHCLWLGEVIGTASLLVVIHGCIRTGQKSAVPFAVGGWVCAGYFFTSSTIFANPAVTIGRMFTDTFAGIKPSSVGAFVGFQILGGLIGFALIKFYYPQHLSPKRDNNLYLRICIQNSSAASVHHEK
jgi:glycerol uptake facilitator-like aquaporin